MKIKIHTSEAQSKLAFMATRVLIIIGSGLHFTAVVI